MGLQKLVWRVWSWKDVVMMTLFAWLYQIVINSLILLISLYLARSVTPTLGSTDIYYHSSNPFQHHLKQHLTHDQLNRLRVERAEKLLAAGNLSQFQMAQENSPPPRMAIAITASDRKMQELFQMMGFISAHITSSYPIVICNTVAAGHRPESIRRFENTTHVIDINLNLTDWRQKIGENRWQKEARDYLRCMNSTLETLFNSKQGPEYLLVLEDDAIPIPLFQAAITSVMNQMDTFREIDYVKLYKRWDWRGIPSAVESFMVSVLIAYFMQICLWHNRNLIVVAAVVAVTQTIWRMYFRELISDARFTLSHHVVLAQAEECCTQAVIYRASKVPQILEAMWAADKPFRWPKDLTLDKSGFMGFTSDVNLVVHIGYYSSIRQKFNPPNA